MALEDVLFPPAGLNAKLGIFNTILPINANTLVLSNGTNTFRDASDHSKLLVTELNAGRLVPYAVFRDYVSALNDNYPALTDDNIDALLGTYLNFINYYYDVIIEIQNTWLDPDWGQSLMDMYSALQTDYYALLGSFDDCPYDAGYLEEIADLEDTVADLQAALNTKDAQINTLTLNNQILQTNYDNAIAAQGAVSDALAAEQSAHSTTIANYNNQINALQTAHASALAGKQAEIDALNAQIQALQGDTSALDAMRAERDAAIANYNTEHAEVIRITNLYNALYGSSSTQAQALAQALEREALANDTIAARDIMITTLNKEIYRLNEELNKAQNKIDELEARPTNETVLAQLQEDIRILQENYEIVSLLATNLQAEVNITNTKLDSSEGRNLALARRIQELEQTINDSASAATTQMLKDDLERAEEDINELEEELRALDDENTRLLLRIDTLVKQIQDHVRAAEQNQCNCGWTTIKS